MRTKFVRVIAVWLAVLAGLAGLGVQHAPAAHADTASEEQQFLDLTNQLRATLGIQQLTPHPELTNIARNWSAQMAAAGGISHNPNFANQVTANWTRLGENVGTGGGVQVIQTAFINSPHHYENLANGAYNFVGIGVVHGATGAIFVTVDFMTASGGGAPAPAPAPRAAAPAPRAAPRATTPAAPRVTTPRPAPARAPTPPVTAPPALPAPAPVPVGVGVKGSPALNQVLAELRALDSH